MTTEKFNELKYLEFRINQLKLFRKFLESFFNQKPFAYEINIRILGTENFLSMPYVNGKGETMEKFVDSEEAQKILKYIDKLISELELKFSKL